MTGGAVGPATGGADQGARHRTAAAVAAKAISFDYVWNSYVGMTDFLRAFTSSDLTPMAGPVATAARWP
jgi:hypothetical protein